MAGEKERAFLSTEKLKDNADLKQLAEQLNQLIESDEGKKKLTKNLDKGVSDVLKKNGIVGKIQEVYKSQDNAQAKAGLERLMKLAKVEDEVRDEQREINVRLEALREQQALSEEIRNDANQLKDAIKAQISKKIEDLYRSGDYQGALDNAVYLMSAEDRAVAFSMIKQILKITPSGETLYIKDKKISYSKRREWIQKMDDNFEAASREFQKSYYPEASITDDFTLTEVTDKHSDKKAAKKLDKELSGNKDLYKITKRINVPSAGGLIEANIDAIRKVFDDAKKEHPNDSKAVEAEVKKKLDKAFFVNHEYLPKDGKKLAKADDLSNKEWEALVDLCTYRMWTELEEPTEGKTSAKASYDALILSQVSGVGTSELEQARGVLKQVDVDKFKVPEGASEAEKKQAKQKAKETLMTLLGDLNWDGRVTNTSTREGVDRKGLDKGTLFGGQVLNMFDTAVKRFGEEQVIKNIESVIKGLNGLNGFEVKPKTIEGLIVSFKNNPSALIAFRNKLMNEPDSGNGMFNAGTEYVTAKLDRLNREANFRKLLNELVEKGNPELEKAIDAMNVDFVKHIRDVVLPNLEKFIEAKRNEDLSDEDKNNILKLENIVNKWKQPGGIEEFLSSPSVRNMYKNFIISGIGANFSDIRVDGEHVYAVGIGGSVSSEKLNDWLSKATGDVLSKASASVGLYNSDGKFSLGFGIGTGASKNIGDNARVFYNVGASWSPFEAEGLGFSAVVGEETRVNPSADNSLDLKAAHFIGVVGAYGVGLNLSDRNLNMSTLSGTVYWRKDKLEGVERKAEKVREKMAPIFNHLFEIKGDVTVQTIIENLRGGKMNDGKEFSGFANTDGDTLYKTAVAIFNMYNSYKGKLGEGANKEQIIQKISENFADNLYREMRNEDIEKIVKEGLHLSGASVGVSFSFARLFTGFFLSGGLTFTYYEDSEYKENPEALRKAQKGMENPDNYDIITNKSKTYKEKMDTINDILGDKYLTYYPESIIKTLPEFGGGKQAPYITLSKEAFGKDIKIMCSPDLAPYIIQENGEIKLPGNADISLAQIRHQGKVESTLILGAKSTAGCEAIKLDNDKLSWEGKSSVEFGSKKDEFEKYNTEIKTKVESMKVGLDGKPNDELKNYLESNGDALVKFRLSSVNYKKFLKAVQDRERDDFVVNAIQYLPDELKALVTTTDDSQARHDVRFIYASLSRVSQTRDKQLSGEALKDKANEYLNGLSLSASNKETLVGYISKVQGGEALSDDEWSKMKSILNINYDNWEYRTSNSKAERLFHMLTPIKKLAEHRTRSYERRINSEYSNLTGGADILISARNESLKKLEGKPSANGGLQEGWIGAVAGYDDRNSITDKFVSSPKIISGSEYLIPDSENLKYVKKHFLDELSRDDADQFKYIKEKIISTLEKSTKKEDKDLAQKWETMHDAEFIDAILSEKTKNEKGEDVLKVSFNMQYGFFADCVNETILLGDINVITTIEEQIQAPHDVHYYDATIVNDAVTIGHDFSIGATFGRVDTERLEEPEDSEPPKEPEEPQPPETIPTEEPTGSTEPFLDLDALNAAMEVDFEGKFQQLKDGTYKLMNYTTKDGHKCVIAINVNNTKEKFIVTQDGSLVPFDGTSWPSILSHGTEVDGKIDPNDPRWQDYLKKMEQYKIDHEKRVEDHAKWQREMDKYNKAHGKFLEDYDTYMKRQEEILKILPEVDRDVAREIMSLNYHILIAKPGEASDLIAKKNSLMQKVNSTIIERILE